MILSFQITPFKVLSKMEDLQPEQQKSKASLTCESEVEEFLLTWDNHQKNVSEAFCSLRNDEFFSDITLACEDQQFKAHKVVLAASSLFFEKVLKNHQHPNPLIFLMGVEVRHMESLLDFMYCGEVSLQQVELEDFFKAGEELGVKGLTAMATPDSPVPPTQKFGTCGPHSMKPDTFVSPPLNNTSVKGIQPQFVESAPIIEDSSILATAPRSPSVAKYSSLVNITYFWQDMNENHSIEEKVKSEDLTMAANENLLPVVEKWEDLENYVLAINIKDQKAGHHAKGCSICGRVMEASGKKKALDRMIAHIEAKHFRRAFIHPCAMCGETFKTKAILNNHIKKNHTA